jgi:outer membrane protein assembly factor BamD (BamD/ComL family)
MSGSSITLRGIAFTAAAAATALLACAGTGRNVNSASPLDPDRLMKTADSLFADGNFEDAKTTYEKIRLGQPPTSPEAQRAHYYIAYIDVFYQNPWADWNSALTEFKSFAALYTNDPHIDEVRSWIRILTTIKSFETEYRKTSHQMERLTATKNATRETQRFHLDSMAGILRSSYEAVDSAGRKVDSLARKNTELIKTIMDLEKKCQQAGK